MGQDETATGQKIRLLSEEVYNRIAAGEVVERPASVLKELIENSLDAGATSVEVSVAGAGQGEICVSDDGEGMSRDDLLLAFQRHATSKVSSVVDLQAIRTLGFRGEALSAIASVSRVEATSRLKGDLSGHRIRLHGGKIQDVEEVGTPPGTTVAVRDLFFNTPARKKFLKTRGVESGHLLHVFKRYALAYPEVRWSLQMDGKDVYRLPPESTQSRMLALFSEELTGRVFPVQDEAGGTRLSGFAGSPELARRSRGDQHLFVNRRWVQNRLLGHAVISAYGSLLEERKFPLYILFLNIPEEEVDVNVHPAKSEVKFRREHEIYNFVQDGVVQALQQAGLEAFPALHLKQGEKLDAGTGEIRSAPFAKKFPRSTPPFGPRTISAPSSTREAPRRGAAPLEAYQLVFGQKEEAAEQPEEIGEERTQVYQLHQRYIVTEIKGGIAIIDQHAAHERILYEQALRALTSERFPSQQLLFPKIIELDPENAVRLREVLEDLQKLGVTIREFGERSFVLVALPAGVGVAANDRVVLDILDELEERGAARNPGRDQIAAAFACRAAVKFGQALTLREMNTLIDQLFATQFPFSCPHGRPTLLQLTLAELERRFGRT